MPETFTDVGSGWVLVVLGVVNVGIFLKLVLIFWRRRRTWTTTDATVGKVRVREASASGGDGGTFVSYHFTDHTGQQHSGVGSPWFRTPKRKSILRIRYDPESPDMNEIVTPLWGEVTIVVVGIAAGVALALFGLSGDLDG